ncbi:Phosphoenolpyruvate-protein phosphotransferase of PTS system (EC [Olavius sp. associated proteobacterium Delta 1]|nr:Phosphoenolpyruvate-protein phosphotransferase of PTS system (EC [Olavius sp. associated proteobacterium Delta 1]
MVGSQSNPDKKKNQHTASVLLTNKIGLHARPAIQLTKLAKRFSSQIQIKTAPDSPWIDAKSIVQVMAAKAPKGTVLDIAVNGKDARQALLALVELIKNNFGEKPADSLDASSEAGHIASRGLAIGKVVVYQKRLFDERSSGTAENEMQLFHRSIKATQSALGSLIENAEKDIAEVLEYQLSLLKDRSLIDPAVAAIATGTSAHSAWTQTLNELVGRFEKTDDQYFRGRTSDLVDLKQHVLGHIYGKTETLPPLSQDSIVIAEDLSPSDFALLDRRHCKGIALNKGSLNSHVALLARSRGIPMLVGLATVTAKADTPAILDAVEGQLIVAPDQETVANYQRRLESEEKQGKALQTYLTVKPTMPTGERVYVGINVGTLEDLKLISPDHCDGIGLVRTEFLFDSGMEMPDEEKQFQVYKKLAQWAGEKPVIVRTLDAGGDKPVEGLTEKDESNPFLGVRGIRLSLLNEDVFRIQLSALVRASAHGNLKIMLPMVTVPLEVERVKNLLQEILVQLQRKDPALTAPPLGIMVEVPAVAMCIEDFDTDFFSIGSNDLIQYVTACDRGEPKVAHLYTGANRAVLQLIRTTIDHGRRTGKQVSLCGDMASQSDYFDVLLDLGLRHLSVSPADLARVKAAITARNENKIDKK